MFRDLPKKRIAFVTGTRADWGKLVPLSESALELGFTLSFFVTGMHMLRRYGDTRLEVRRQAKGNIYEFVNQSPGDPHELVLQKTIQGFGDWITEYPADLVVVHGDRVEALAVALVCAMKYLPCAHVEGGEVSGTIDEIYRHAITKLARFHFVSSVEAKERVRLLGEDPGSIFVIGSPELDLHSSELEISLDDVKSRYAIHWDDFGILIFHPVTSERDQIGKQARALFDALVDSNRPFVVIAPNNDPGCEEIFEILESLPPERFRLLPSLRFEYFSVLLRNSSVVVGNSSLGVREAPFLGIASLNVGTRQHGRSSAESIWNVDPFDREAIEVFLVKNWGKRFERSISFGSGSAGRAFKQVLSEKSFWMPSRQKFFHDPDSFRP